MKSTSGQVFAISLLSLLAALSFWLDRTISAGVAEPDGKSRHDPDAIAENFSVAPVRRESGASSTGSSRPTWSISPMTRRRN